MELQQRGLSSKSLSSSVRSTNLGHVNDPSWLIVRGFCSIILLRQVILR
jgi:hypothetical protein